MPAGYEPGWISSFVEALDCVKRAGWANDEACDGFLDALGDGAVATRWADTQELIDPSLWVKPIVLIDGIGPIIRGSCASPYRVIEFRRADIERLWRPPARAKQPRPEKGYWLLARDEALKWLEDEGAPTERGDQAKLERHIAEFLAHRKQFPAESTIRIHVVEWIAEFAKSRKA